MEAREALLARVSTADGETEIKDPATGEVIGRHTFGTPEDVKAAVDQAAKAQPAWAALTDEERVGFLSASVWSADRDRAKEIAARLEAGTVWVNGHGGIHPMIPFGGAKHSGYGLEFGVEGLKSVSVPQVISG